MRFGSARLFSRWYADLRGGMHVVVAVVSKPVRARDWIITAYLTRQLAAGLVEWKRN
jgi:hypothetical protein